MIRFKYNINGNLLPLIRSEMVDFVQDFIVGYLDEGYATQLNRCNLYLCCDYKYENYQHIYSNPIGIVAPNQQMAAVIYSTIYNGKDCFIHSILKDNCKNMVVEAL